MWQDKTRRLEACGDEYKLAPAFNINALRMLMTATAKEYLDLWEGDRDNTDNAKSNEELLNKVQRQTEKAGKHRPEKHATRE